MSDDRSRDCWGPLLQLAVLAMRRRFADIHRYRQIARLSDNHGGGADGPAAPLNVVPGRRGEGVMQVHQARYFLALCEEQTFTRAAKRCGVSQPSITNAIGRLEQSLAGPLFRDRGNIKLTELGRAVRPHLERLTQSAYEAKCEAAKVLSATQIPHQPKAMEAFMRAHHVIAVVAVLVIGFGAKLYLFPPKQAEADVFSTATMNVLQLQTEVDMKQLPAQKMHDRTFVFDSD